MSVVVVTGLPRSGTSLMMAMLESGGIPPLTDDIRQADVDNPKGYYEFERVKKLPVDISWLPDAEGKAVKVLAELIKHLPSDRDFKVIFMMRELSEIIASQKKMMKRRGEDSENIPDAELLALYRSYLKNLKTLVNGSPRMKVLYVNYNELMADPSVVLDELVAFLGGSPDRSAMQHTIDATLYRNRS